jgi:hypothetical protein
MHLRLVAKIAFLLRHVRLSVCLRVSTRLPLEICFCGILLKSVETIQNWLISVTLREDLSTFMLSLTLNHLISALLE